MFNRLLILICLLFALHFQLHSAFEVQMIEPQNIACGSVVSVLPGGLNYSTIMDEYGINMRASYVNLFGINELAFKSATIFWNKDMQNGFGCRVSSSGDKGYNESLLSLGYARKIKERISLSLGINWYNLAIYKFYRTNSLAFDIGSIFHLTKNFSMSLFYKNINKASLWKYGEPLPQLFCSGLRWKVHQRIDLISEIYKDMDYPFITKIGTKVEIIKHIKGFAGVQLNPDRYSYGICCYWKNLEISAAYQSHFELPQTIYFGCKFSIK